MARVQQFDDGQLHQRHRLGEFIDQLRSEGRAIREIAWGDAPDAWVVVDGARTAVELTCAYVGDTKELWKPDPRLPFNVNFSSSGDDMQAARRRIGPDRAHLLAADLNARMRNKRGDSYGERSYLVLDPTHDYLDEQVAVDSLLSRIQIPRPWRFRGTYLAEPRFEKPRRFRLIAGER